MNRSFSNLAFITLLSISTNALADAKKLLVVPPRPAAAPGAIRLDELGFSKEESQSNPEKQRLLNQRSSMLQVHQIMGLVTLGLMTGAFFTSRESKPATLAHKLFGYTATGAYAATAYLSLAAPEPEGLSEKGWGMTIHRVLLFVHLPGMILTPIAGYLADKNFRENKPNHGLGEYKSTIATTTYIAFGAAALSATINF